MDLKQPFHQDFLDVPHPPIDYFHDKCYELLRFLWILLTDEAVWVCHHVFQLSVQYLICLSNRLIIIKLTSLSSNQYLSAPVNVRPLITKIWPSSTTYAMLPINSVFIAKSLQYLRKHRTVNIIFVTQQTLNNFLLLTLSYQSSDKYVE